MKSVSMRVGAVVATMLVLGAAGAVVWAADPPAAPATSTYAPAEDLIAQVNASIKDLEEALSSADDFEVKQTRVKREANTLAALGLVLAWHDTDHPLKNVAPALVPAAQKLAAAKSLDEAQPALAGVQSVLAGSSEKSDPPAWGKVASLGALMKQVTFVNSRLRRNVTGSRFAMQANDTARYAALLAAIAQATQYDTHEVKDEAQLPQWYDYSIAMRDSAGRINAAAKAGDQDAAKAALGDLDKSCSGCHKTFRVEGQ
ncbi:MAG: cytochrome c [Pirellulales bacterium]|nr:cytochrome c [Pirellulales bacterium]